MNLQHTYKKYLYLASSRYFWKMEDTFEDTYHKILIVHLVRCSTPIISQPFAHLQGTIYGYAYITWLHEITIILEHKSSNNSEPTKTRYYLVSCIFRIRLKSTFILHLQDTFKKYLAQHCSVGDRKLSVTCYSQRVDFKLICVCVWERERERERESVIRAPLIKSVRSGIWDDVGRRNVIVLPRAR